MVVSKSAIASIFKQFTPCLARCIIKAQLSTSLCGVGAFVTTAANCSLLIGVFCIPDRIQGNLVLDNKSFSICLPSWVPEHFTGVYKVKSVDAAWNTVSALASLTANDAVLEGVAGVSASSVQAAAIAAALVASHTSAGEVLSAQAAAYETQIYVRLVIAELRSQKVTICKPR